jgi:hypothetical protein
MLALNTTKIGVNVMATPSYRERMKATRAEARAKREAEKTAWLRRATLIAEVQRMSLEAVKDTIRDRGDRVTHYSHAQLRAQAEQMIGPWLVVQAKLRIAERNSKHVRNAEVPS